MTNEHSHTVQKFSCSKHNLESSQMVSSLMLKISLLLDFFWDFCSHLQCSGYPFLCHRGHTSQGFLYNLTSYISPGTSEPYSLFWYSHSSYRGHALEGYPHHVSVEGLLGRIQNITPQDKVHKTQLQRSVTLFPVSGDASSLQGAESLCRSQHNREGTTQSLSE